MTPLELRLLCLWVSAMCLMTAFMLNWKER